MPARRARSRNDNAASPSSWTRFQAASMIASRADWREARRQSAREAIIDAAWNLVHEEGLAALSLRDLARRAGITTPTVYAYFDSKHAIYDAMFGQAATEFADRMAKSVDGDEPQEILAGYAHRFVEFCI